MVFVCARHTKDVLGRKRDVEECQWLLKLHSVGRLNNSFQPIDEIRIARTLWRHRGSLVAEASSVIQRLQKVPTEMMSGCPRRQSLALTYNPGVIVLSRRFEAVWS